VALTIFILPYKT